MGALRFSPLQAEHKLKAGVVPELLDNCMAANEAHQYFDIIGVMSNFGSGKYNSQRITLYYSPQ